MDCVGCAPVDERRLAHIGEAYHAGPHSAWLETPLRPLSIQARAGLLHHPLKLQIHTAW